MRCAKACSVMRKIPGHNRNVAPATAAKGFKCEERDPRTQLLVSAQPASTPKTGAAVDTTGMSPLEAIRAQAAAGSTATQDPVSEPVSAPAADALAESAEETPPAAPPQTSPVDTSGMSPLDIIRAQGAFKGDR